MIELPSYRPPALARWFPAGAPGPATLGEHVLLTGVGRWWADAADRPRAVAVSCADHVVLRGDPRALAPGDLAPLAGCYLDAPARFLPVLRSAFDRLVPYERMVWTQQEPARRPPVPRGVRVRRLEPGDAAALRALGPDAAWIAATWGGPEGLAASAHGWAAVRRDGRILALACTYFRGSRYEDVAVFTAPDHRRHRLALACVTALCADIAARGHVPGWDCSTMNRPSRLLAWTAGFRLVREYVHYAAGGPVRQAAGATAPASRPGAALPSPLGASPLGAKTN
ncbi:GNAT family N-acetyltransferase [Streptomyces sp. NPDC003077]|uniref:GNAT family N-acetyltransferase n=1 Tax=Streptomyces sp. NPDC003077 TaxID=3154443 RepID=UPI0033BCDE6B